MRRGGGAGKRGGGQGDWTGEERIPGGKGEKGRTRGEENTWER